MKKVFLWAVFLLIFLLSFTKPDLAFAHSYELPYPGLLPDSPLYFLRVTRDRVVGFLISDPLKKTEYNLLQADKRLNAGIYLFNKGKVELAVSTISKAENYFEKAIESMKIAKMQGIDIKEIGSKLLESSRKHQEVLIDLEKKANKTFKSNFSVLQKRTIDFETKVESLIIGK